MIFLLLFLTIATKHGLADVYEMIPEDYINYNRDDDVNNTEDPDAGPEVGKIKYDELISLLHNEYSNKALLEHINKEDNNTGNVRKETTTLSAFEDNTREAREREDWKRLKRDDNVTDKALLANSSNSIDIPNLVLDSNQLKKVIDIVQKANIKSEHNFNITEKTTDKYVLNVTEPTVKDDSNSTRPKRHTAIKLLRNLFHHTPETPENKSVAPPSTKTSLPLRQSSEDRENSTFADLMVNLTKSIKILNERLSNLKLHVNENVGFVMIKAPINAIKGRRYLKQIEGENNETKSQDIRIKRDVAENSTEGINNITLESNVTNFNVSKNDNTIIDGNVIIEPTIITDSETINKSKRDADVTTELNNSTTNTANVAETSNVINNSRRYDNDNTEPAIESKPIETNDTKHIDSESLNNNTENLKPSENSRKFLGNRDDILFFIEKEYNDIKNLITPMEDVRDKYSSTILYKIGYIIANLDTMEVTLNKLKNRVFKSKWGTVRLEQVYKKLSMSRKLVNDVMRYLESYVENQLGYEQ